MGRAAGTIKPLVSCIPVTEVASLPADISCARNRRGDLRALPGSLMTLTLLSLLLVFTPAPTLEFCCCLRRLAAGAGEALGVPVLLVLELVVLAAAAPASTALNDVELDAEITAPRCPTREGWLPIELLMLWVLLFWELWVVAAIEGEMMATTVLASCVALVDVVTATAPCCCCCNSRAVALFFLSSFICAAISLLILASACAASRAVGLARASCAHMRRMRSASGG